MKQYQVELKVKGEGGVYPYTVSSMKEEWTEKAKNDYYANKSEGK